MKIRLDPDALYVALDRRRRRHRLSWRAVAGEAGVSPAALSRLSSGRRPDADTLVRLLAWLGSTDLAPYVTTEDAIDRLSTEDLARATEQARSPESAA